MGSLVEVTEGVNVNGGDLFGRDYPTACFDISSLNPAIAGWPAVWALYATLVQYLPILISLGFLFLFLISKSTLVHFLTNVIGFSWFLNFCLEQKFKIPPNNPACVATLHLGDLQLFGPVYAVPPLEITQSIALTVLFVFYVYIWKPSWPLFVNKTDKNFPSVVLDSENQEKPWLLILAVLLMVQNPLLLWIRGVYSLFSISIGILVGMVASSSIISVYMFWIYMFDRNQTYKNAVTQLPITMNNNIPIDDPFIFFNIYWISYP